MILDADRSTSVLVVTADLEPRDLDAILRTCVAHTERSVATPDFDGAAWLVEAAHPAADGPDTERVVQLVQWAKPTAAEAFSDGSIHAAHLEELRPMLRAVDTEAYRLGEVVSVEQPRRATIEDATDSGADLVHAIITFEPAPGARDWLNDYNQSATRDHIRHLTGFVSASFLIAERTERLVEFVQWRSPEDLHAASLDERFREHVNVSNQYSRSEMRMYHLHRTLGG